MKYLLDTNICIYIIKNQYTEIVNKIDSVGIENIAVSSITIAEMEFGIAKSSKPKLAESKLYEFLVPFEIYDFNTSSARHYGKIRAELAKSGTPIGPMDMLIASIALANEMTIITNNVKEFERINELQIENWIK
jgi:tRNA(fMet)-specific endonuclease VapC